MSSVLIMQFTRATKNFLRYDSVDPNGVVPSLYIKKSGLTGQPATIHLEIKVVGKGKA